MEELQSEESKKSLQESIDNLSSSINELLNVFKTASDDIHTEQDSDMSRKLDLIIEQNQHFAKAILLLLEGTKEQQHTEKTNSRKTFASQITPISKIEPTIK